MSNIDVGDAEAVEHQRRRALLGPDRQPAYRFGLLLALLIVTFIFVGTAPTGRWVTLVTFLLIALTLFTALFASGAQRRTVIVAVVVATIGLGVALAQVIGGDASEHGATTGVTALLVIVAPYSIVRGVVRRRMLDLRTVIAALCLYVMLGLFFSFVFQTIQVATGHPFFVEINRDNPADFLYYSFATLTTVGYGDLTAAANGSRTLSVFEAMVGQLYLVTVVALLVSNLRPVFSSTEDQAKTQDQAG